MSAMRNSTKMTEMTADTTDEGDEVEVVEVTTSLSLRQSGTTIIANIILCQGVGKGRGGLGRPSQFLKRVISIYNYLAK